MIGGSAGGCGSSWRVLLVATVLLVAAWSGCAEDPGKSLEASLAELRSCPRGDEPWREAVELAQEQGDLTRLSGLCQRIAAREPARWEPAWAQARCLVALEQSEAAKGLFREALKRARRSQDSTGIARSADDLAWLQYLAGDLPGSEALFCEALEQAQRAGRADLAAFIRNNLAPVLIDRGRIVEAIAQFSEVETALRKLGLQAAALGAAYNQAVLLIELGDAHGAQRQLEKLHAEADLASEKWTLDAAAVVLGNLHEALGERSAALEWYERVGPGHPGLWARARLGLGWIAINQGENERAELILASVAELMADKDKPLALLAGVYRAAAVAEGGRPEIALQQFEALERAAKRFGVDESFWDLHWIRGRVHRDMADQSASLADFERSVEILHTQRERLDPRGEGLRFLRERREPFLDLALARARKGDLGGVFQLHEWAKSQALRSDEIAAGRPPLERLQDIQRALQPGDLILDYLLGERAGLLLAITGESVSAHQIPGRNQLGPSLVVYRRGLQEFTQAPEMTSGQRLVGRTLRRELLGPVEHLVSGATRVLVVPDLELALLPFASLPGGKNSDGLGYLGLSHEIAVLSHAGPPPVWEGARTPVLLAGQPRLSPESGFAELPWSAFELSGLGEIWADAEPARLHGKRFTGSALAALPLNRFRTLHFATHAVAATRDPSKCAVILSDGERLGIDQIARLDLPSSLVVLSACRSGDGELVPGEGILGLGRAFLEGGAKGVIVSPWRVEDAASAKLMVEFHQQLQAGEDPSRALLIARHRAASRRLHPGSWAAFELVLRPARLLSE